MHTISTLNRCYVCSVQPVLVSRFLVNLRYADHPETQSEDARLSRFTIYRFCPITAPSAVGNMGEPLHCDLEEDIDDVCETALRLPAVGTTAYLYEGRTHDSGAITEASDPAWRGSL